ncbi:unnamed protein product [Larinioides sclopetarius]|uniref:Uncharacterized protein n=1 Tax=Larinioides sclopetarius TaxID=280406 RepID=A0AAV2A5F4_9ARAC
MDYWIYQRRRNLGSCWKLLWKRSTKFTVLFW